MSLASLLDAMGKAVVELDGWPEREVLILHHNDADGLSSAAILTRAFERRGVSVEHLCLEKPYPEALESVFDRRDAIIVMTDFGGRIAPRISQLNRGRNLVLILDHHKAEAPTDPRVHNLDPELHGLHGDRDISASTTCYLFACALDADNRDLAPLAVIGAVGDGFTVDGRLVGPNRDAAAEARQQGRLAIDEDGSGERYTLIAASGPVPIRELVEELDLLGAVGFHSGGPARGVELCLSGARDQVRATIAELRALRDQRFAEELERIERGELHRTEHLQWIHVHDRFEPMGVKTIGAFLEAHRDSDWVDSGRYLAGFQNIPDRVPGLGPLGMDQVKISMRVSSEMTQRIRSGRDLGLDRLLPEATRRVGGFSDACHSLAAATTVARGLEERLIAEMEKILA